MNELENALPVELWLVKKAIGSTQPVNFTMKEPKAFPPPVMSNTSSDKTDPGVNRDIDRPWAMQLGDDSKRKANRAALIHSMLSTNKRMDYSSG